MTVAERIHNDAMNHLAAARRSMEKLAACTDDWTADVLLEIEFENIKNVCREFGECQFGIQFAPTHEKHEKTHI